MKKKPYILAFMLFLAVSFAASCGKWEPEKEPEKETELTQETPFGRIALIHGMSDHDVAWCEKGILTAECAEGDTSGAGNMLYFTEFGTGQKYLLCSDAYCKHEPVSYKNPDPVCEATMEGILCACIYGSNLYVLQQNGVEGILLWVRDLTKKGYQKLAELPYTYGIGFTAYHAVFGTKLYYFAGKLDKDAREIGMYTHRNIKTILLEVDLTTGKYKELMDFDIGDGRYRILQALYKEKGVFVWCYMEDSYDSYEDGNLEYVLLDYKEKFFYIPYDGTKPTECYGDVLTEKSRMRVSEDEEWGYATMAWGADGCYLVPKEGDRVVLDRFPDRQRERIYTIREDEQEIKNIQVSGDVMLLAVLKKTGEKELVCVNLKDGSQNRTEYGYEYFGMYHSIADGVFESRESASLFSENVLRMYDWNGLEKKVILEIGW